MSVPSRSKTKAFARKYVTGEVIIIGVRNRKEREKERKKEKRRKRTENISNGSNFKTVSAA